MMYRMSQCDRLCAAMRCVELRHTEAEQAQVLSKLYELGWSGGSVFPAYMSMILWEVSPMLMDEELRKLNLRGYGEDTQ